MGFVKIIVKICQMQKSAIHDSDTGGVVISRLVGCSASSGNDGPALDDIAIGAFCPHSLPDICLCLYLCACACDIAIGPTYRLPDLCLYLYLCACDIAIGAFCPHRLLDFCLYLCLCSCEFVCL